MKQDKKQEIQTIFHKIWNQQESIFDGLYKIQMLLSGPKSMQNEGLNDPYQNEEEK